MERQTTSRLLGAADAPALERFLVQHRDSSMFLRSNARRGGLEYAGKPEQGTYFAAFSGEEIVGVVSHSWSGAMLVQAPGHVEMLAPSCVQHSGRKVTGLNGVLGQVRRARAALGLGDAPVKVDADERLFALELRELVVPEMSARIECRAPVPAERETLLRFRVAYDLESLGGSDTEETRARAADFLDRQIARDQAIVALDGGKLVSLSAFNCTLLDIVQLGGIYTPPELRSRGYARVATAAALLIARERGATRAVLFANRPDAIRCYESLGFPQIGEYGLVLFA
jgi:GNAT superfamily N-acetyltransferase